MPVSAYLAGKAEFRELCWGVFVEDQPTYALADYLEENREEEEGQLVNKLRPLTKYEGATKSVDKFFDLMAGEGKLSRPRADELLVDWLLRIGVVEVKSPYACQWAQCFILAGLPDARRDMTLVRIRYDGPTPTPDGSRWHLVFVVPFNEATVLESAFNAMRAAAAVNSFTRAQLREDSFYRRVMPPVHIPASQELMDQDVITGPAFQVVNTPPVDRPRGWSLEDAPVEVFEAEPPPVTNIPIGTEQFSPLARYFGREEQRPPVEASTVLLNRATLRDIMTWDPEYVKAINETAALARETFDTAMWATVGEAYALLHAKDGDEKTGGPSS